MNETHTQAKSAALKVGDRVKIDPKLNFMLGKNDSGVITGLSICGKIVWVNICGNLWKFNSNRIWEVIK